MSPVVVTWVVSYEGTLTLFAALPRRCGSRLRRASVSSHRLEQGRGGGTCSTIPSPMVGRHILGETSLCFHQDSRSGCRVGGSILRSRSERVGHLQTSSGPHSRRTQRGSMRSRAPSSV